MTEIEIQIIINTYLKNILVHKLAIRADRCRRSMEQIDEISIEIEDQDQLKAVRAQKLEKEGFSSLF